MKIKKILLAEGEKDTCDRLYSALTNAEYAVDIVFSADAGQPLFRTNTYDLVLINDRLPDTNGCDFCTYIRKIDAWIPVVMISLGHSDDKLESFRSGADDYILITDDLRELLLRIKALERRCLQSVRRDYLIRAAGIVIDPESMEVWRFDKLIQLSAKEFFLLHLLAINKNKIVSFNDIIAAMWGKLLSSKQNRIWAFIASLRKKIGDDTHQKCIYTVTGKGYVLTETNAQKSNPSLPNH